LTKSPGERTATLYLVTGHSFGGAIVISALKSFVLERIAAAGAKNPDHDCIASRPFGHGVVLLNPAIEANKLFQLKELVAATCFGPSQPRLIHVISSDADLATNKAFGLGQWLGGSLARREAVLTREFDGREVQFRESDLDTITVGNFMPFQTGQLDLSTDSRWDYRSCVGGQMDCLDAAAVAQHIPAKPNEPLAFIQAHVSFIANHNDVFNDDVSAYLAAVVAVARYKRILDGSSVGDPRLSEECQSDNFGACFDFYQRLFQSVE
jgi:hypothetical protein